MSDNLAIWDRLGRTSPEHTKGFTRGGGFKGTAVKPIYTEQKMTEMFGPCGIGWGFSEPTFQLVPGSDGQTAVYCWLSLWYVHDGARSAPIPGVGGDFVIVKQSSGLRTDDEAFKKAFTDAIGNAMKHLGMSADVHMGRFDDSKYVNELKREDAENNSNSAPSGRNAADTGSRNFPASAAPLSEVGEEYRQEMMKAATKDDLGHWMAANTEPMKLRLGEAEASAIRTLAAARYRELPEGNREAAE